MMYGDDLRFEIEVRLGTPYLVVKQGTFAPYFHKGHAAPVQWAEPYQYTMLIEFPMTKLEATRLASDICEYLDDINLSATLTEILDETQL